MKYEHGFDDGPSDGRLFEFNQEKLHPTYQAQDTRRDRLHLARSRAMTGANNILLDSPSSVLF